MESSRYLYLESLDSDVCIYVESLFAEHILDGASCDSAQLLC